MELNIEELIKDQIAEIDIRSSVNSVVRQMVEPEVKQKIKKLTDKRVTEIIDLEIQEIMSKGVETDDGWGKKAKYPSFEELFKTEFRKRIDSTYEVKRLIDESIKKQVEDLFRANGQTIAKKFAEELIKIGSDPKVKS